MRVKLCKIEDLILGDEFFNVDVVEDGNGNVYMPNSKFLVLKVDKKLRNAYTGNRKLAWLFLHDEEGRDIEVTFEFGRIYKGFGSNTFSAASEVFVSH